MDEDGVACSTESIGEGEDPDRVGDIKVVALEFSSSHEESLLDISYLRRSLRRCQLLTKSDAIFITDERKSRSYTQGNKYFSRNVVAG